MILNPLPRGAVGSLHPGIKLDSSSYGYNVKNIENTVLFGENYTYDSSYYAVGVIGSSDEIKTSVNTAEIISFLLFLPHGLAEFLR